MNSIELYKPNNSALNKIGKLFSIIPNKSKRCINSVNVNMKRNYMIKKYKAFTENDKHKEKFIKAYNLYIESLSEYMMNKVYKRVKLEVANEYEKEILSEYYYILKIKEESFEEYECRKQKYLMNLDYENIQLDEKNFQIFKKLYEYNINNIYNKLFNLKKANNELENNYEYLISIIEEYNNDKFVEPILQEKNIKPYICDTGDDNVKTNIVSSNIEKYKTYLNIAENVFSNSINKDFINYINGLIDTEKEKMKKCSPRKIKNGNVMKEKKKYIKKKGSKANGEKQEEQ